MNKEILEQYVSMKAERIELEAQISKLSAGIAKLEKDEVADSVTCGRRGKKPIRTVKIHGIPMREITSRKQRLQRRRLEYKLLIKKIEETTEAAELYINSIEDSELRRLLRLRYLQGLSWKEVSATMGRGYTVSACKMKVARFLKCDVCDENL